MLRIVAVVLMLNILPGLWRVVRGPTAPDRMVAAMLFGTTGVAFLLVTGEVVGDPSIRDGALLFAVLGALAAVVFARLGAPGRGEPAGGPGAVETDGPPTDPGGDEAA